MRKILLPSSLLAGLIFVSDPHSTNYSYYLISISFIRKLLMSTVVITLSTMGLVRAQDNLEVQDSVWKTGGNINLNVSQVAFSNWAGGGEDAFALGILLGGFTQFERKNTLWKNTMNFAYGIQKLNGGGTRKTDDQIRIVSEVSRKLVNPKWLWTARLNFWSQIARGYIYSSDPDIPDEEISRFMAPGYLQLAMGYSYTEPKIFTLSAFPLTGKFTFVNRDTLATRYGLDDGESSRAEFGASVNANLTKQLMENIKLNTNLNLFSNYDQATQVDINWDMVLLLKVNKYITTSIAAQLIYDHEIDIDREREGIQRRVQFRELINIGFAYDFGYKGKK